MLVELRWETQGAATCWAKDLVFVFVHEAKVQKWAVELLRGCWHIRELLKLCAEVRIYYLAHVFFHDQVFGV